MAAVPQRRKVVIQEVVGIFKIFIDAQMRKRVIREVFLYRFCIFSLCLCGFWGHQSPDMHIRVIGDAKLPQGEME